MVGIRGGAAGIEGKEMSLSGTEGSQKKHDCVSWGAIAKKATERENTSCTLTVRALSYPPGP